MISQSPRSVPSSATAGIAMMLLGISLFSLNDALGKWLVASYSIGQMLLIRSVAAFAVLAPLIAHTGIAPFRNAPRPGLQVVRALCSTAESALFYAALTALPLADVMTYYLAGPIYVTAISALFLGETVRWRRWSAIAVGFCGVLIALRPSMASLNWPALVAVLGSMAFSLLMICTRLVRGTSDVVLVTSQTAGALLFGLVAVPFGWVTPGWLDLSLLMLLGILAMAAHACVNRSLLLAPASVVVPYQYMMIVWAAILGYLIFGDVPAMHVVIGAGIIVAAGIYIFTRERRGPPAIPE